MMPVMYNLRTKVTPTCIPKPPQVVTKLEVGEAWWGAGAAW